MEPSTSVCSLSLIALIIVPIRAKLLVCEGSTTHCNMKAVFSFFMATSVIGIAFIFPKQKYCTAGMSPKIIITIITLKPKNELVFHSRLNDKKVNKVNFFSLIFFLLDA